MIDFFSDVGRRIERRRRRRKSTNAEQSSTLGAHIPLFILKQALGSGKMEMETQAGLDFCPGQSEYETGNEISGCRTLLSAFAVCPFLRSFEAGASVGKRHK